MLWQVAEYRADLFREFVRQVSACPMGMAAVIKMQSAITTASSEGLLDDDGGA